LKNLAGLLALALAGHLACAVPCAAQGVPPPVRPKKLLLHTTDSGAPPSGFERLPPCAPSTISPARFVAPADAPVPELVPTPRNLPSTNLAEAIETALERNPNLVTLRQTEPVSLATLGVARQYPWNPYVQLQVLPYGQDRNGATTPVNHYVLLMQTLELCHQPRIRVAAGVADLSRTRWNIHQAELTNVAQTERMFFAALYLRGVRDLNLSLAKLNEELVGVLDRRFHAGTAVASDVALARLQAHAARQQANASTAAYNTALVDLRTQLGPVSNEPFEPVGDLTRLEWQRSPVSLVSEGKPSAPEVIALVSGRPDVMAARADVEFSRAAADLANANRTPNLQIGPYYQRDDFATVFLGFRSQMDIPIINTGMPLLRQRLAELRQRQVTLAQLEVRAQLEADAALERYERARLLIEETQGQFAQTLADELCRVEDQFRAGQADLLRVYSARNGLIQAERALLDTLNELAQAAARVTETTGLPPHRLIRPICNAPPEPKTETAPAGQP
jgi:outer membrane protein TolC